MSCGFEKLSLASKKGNVAQKATTLVECDTLLSLNVVKNTAKTISKHKSQGRKMQFCQNLREKSHLRRYNSTKIMSDYDLVSI